MKFWLVVGVVLTLSGPSHASTVIAPGSGTTFPYQDWVDSSRLPTPDLEIRVIEEACAEASACTGHSLPIYFAANTRRPHRSFLHEIGHQFDYIQMDDSERAAWLSLVEERRAWYSPPNSPHEQFAEAYAIGATRPHPPRAFPLEAGIGYSYRLENRSQYLQRQWFVRFAAAD